MAVQSILDALGVNSRSQKEVSRLADECGISRETLAYLHRSKKLPSVKDLENLCQATDKDLVSTKIRLGLVDESVIARLDGREPIPPNSPKKGTNRFKPDLSTEAGKLFRADCVEYLKTVESERYDLIFADPPFNLNKTYASKIDDSLAEDEYAEWCLEWLDECVRTLKYGGSFFVYNLPKWNIPIGEFLTKRLTFRHWIAIDLKYSLPIAGRLYPSHYSLLYFTKGPKPTTFTPDRMPMEVCPKCFGDLRDYGGYKAKMNPEGVNLTDIWMDIPPVRHSKYKRRKEANELSIKLLDRIVEMASKKGDLVFDPFGGSGTTYAAAEIKGRRWEGCEIGPVDGIKQRMDGLDEEKVFIEKYRSNYNSLFPPKTKVERVRRKLWTCESVREKANGSHSNGTLELFEN